MKAVNTLLLALLVCIAALGVVAYIKTQEQNRNGPGPGGPQANPRTTIIQESFILKEGEYKAYHFTLTSPANLNLSLNADPERVNLILMSADEYVKFSEVKHALFGGQYLYNTALSSQAVTNTTKSADMPIGTWYIVIERPEEHLLMHKQANVNVNLTGQKL